MKMSSPAEPSPATTDDNSDNDAAPTDERNDDTINEADALLQDQMDHVLNLLQQPVVPTRQVDEAVSSVLSTLQFDNPVLATPTTINKKEGVDSESRSGSDPGVSIVPTAAAAAIASSKRRHPQGREGEGDSSSAPDKEAKRPKTIDGGTLHASHPHNHDANGGNVIRVDMGNYDDDDDEEGQGETNSSNPTVMAAAAAASGLEAPLIPPRSNEQTLTDAEHSERLDRISDIPMGVEAAKMMVTFGDGKYPRPEAIEAALLATRRTIQFAIMDARVVRRRLQTDYVKARLSLDQYINPKVKRQHRATEARNQAEAQAAEAADGDGTGNPIAEGSAASTAIAAAMAPVIDSRIMFRALADGKDRLAVQSKCGFDMEELTHLFPEEMRSYQRWNEMKDDAVADKETVVAVDEADDGDDDEAGSETAASKSSSPSKKGIRDGKDEEVDDQDDEDDEDDGPTGGHLKQRLIQFDVRTDQMTTDWYSKFSKVRQGSFLKGNVSSRRYRQRLDAEHEWDEIRNSSKGRKTTGTWETLTAKSIRFLHWLGFDPPNLCPPEEEVTGALAFLAYDRLGRIVEKAIYLRNMETIESATGSGRLLGHNLWELPPGQQLSKEDIERALEDPDVKPSGIYSNAELIDTNASSGSGTLLSGPSSIQLYFGEGFEDRLELEMEEMIAATSSEGRGLSEEERTIRREEAELLAKISAPPSRDGLDQVLEQNRAQLLQNQKEKTQKKT